jgi:hypothetical protein
VLAQTEGQELVFSAKTFSSSGSSNFRPSNFEPFVIPDWDAQRTSAGLGSLCFMDSYTFSSWTKGRSDRRTKTIGSYFLLRSSR